MSTKYVFLGGLVLTVGLLSYSVAQALVQVSITAVPQFTVSAPGQFGVNITDFTGNVYGKISIEQVSPSAIKSVERFENGSWTALNLQADSQGVTAIVNSLASSMNFRMTFNAPAQGVLGFTIIDSATSQVLSSSAYPITATGGQVLGNTTYVFQANLRFGQRSADVTELQKRLTVEGVYKGPITGYFGPLTLRAVKAYQKSHGVPATGFVGPLTRAELNK